MEINYDLIIKYLAKKEPVKEKKPSFSTQKVSLTILQILQINLKIY